MPHKKTGLVLGKFLPLHKGHELLLTFAANYVDKLYVVVDNIPDAAIPGALRCQWIKQFWPNALVYYLPTPNPQQPSEHPDFWMIWKNSLLNLLPQKPDYLFASENYGIQLAKILDADFIPLDVLRQIIPISGSHIRQSPLIHWDFLSESAKAFYLKRICIFGPESSGKTTLAQSLAQHYNTKWVPEYARLFIETQPQFQQEDMIKIVKGQIALEKAIAPSAKKLLFCDTDPLLTTIWSQWLFHHCPAPMIELTKQHHYDLYLLMKPDLEWKQDAVRFLPGKSEEFFNDCLNTLKKYQRNFVIVSGKDSARLACAIQEIDHLLQRA